MSDPNIPDWAQSLTPAEPAPADLVAVEGPGERRKIPQKPATSSVPKRGPGRPRTVREEPEDGSRDTKRFAPSRVESNGLCQT